jgi:hypothetical protein
VFLVHGEPVAQDAFAEQLRERGYRVHMPTLGERLSLG